METLVTSDNWKMVSEIELVYKTAIKPSERPHVNSSASAFKILLSGWNRDKIEFIEQFKVLLLNRSNRVLGQYELSTGGTSGTVADVRLIFVAALKANASGIIIAHNHPSGEVEPSAADRALTARSEGPARLQYRHEYPSSRRTPEERVALQPPVDFPETGREADRQAQVRHHR